MPRRKPTKTLRPKPVKPKVRIHVTPKLTPSEFKKLQARAASPPQEARADGRTQCLPRPLATCGSVPLDRQRVPVSLW